MTPPRPDGPPVADPSAEPASSGVAASHAPNATHIRGGRVPWMSRVIRGVGMELAGFALAEGISRSQLGDRALLRELRILRGESVECRRVPADPVFFGPDADDLEQPDQDDPPTRPFPGLVPAMATAAVGRLRMSEIEARRDTTPMERAVQIVETAIQTMQAVAEAIAAGPTEYRSQTVDGVTRNFCRTGDGPWVEYSDTPGPKDTP